MRKWAQDTPARIELSHIQLLTFYPHLQAVHTRFSDAYVLAIGESLRPWILGLVLDAVKEGSGVRTVIL